MVLQLKIRERKILDLQAELNEARRELDVVRNEAAVRRAGVDEAREIYRRKLEELMRDVGDLSRCVRERAAFLAMPGLPHGGGAVRALLPVIPGQRPRLA